MVQVEIKKRFHGEQNEFKVTTINLLETAKAAFTKQLIVDVDSQAVNKEFVDFEDKNVKANPGKTSIKFNIVAPKENLNLSLYTLEKGFTMNDEMVGWLEEGQDIVFSVVTV